MYFCLEIVGFEESETNHGGLENLAGNNWMFEIVSYGITHAE